MLTVACVFRAAFPGASMGECYSKIWVYKLQENIKRFLSVPHRFVCLTNTKIPDVECIPLKQSSWEGWWSKIELFAPGLFQGPVLYLDLDVFATAPIDDLIRPVSDFIMLRDRRKHIKNSSIMYWNGQDPRIHLLYNTFNKNSYEIKSQHRDLDSLGDQGFIADTFDRMGFSINLWQDLYGDAAFVPFSFSGIINPDLHEGKLPAQVRFIYCLGYPKFHDYGHLKFVRDNW
jgi:hypothetical protein